MVVPVLLLSVRDSRGSAKKLAPSYSLVLADLQFSSGMAAALQKLSQLSRDITLLQVLPVLLSR